MRWIQQEYACGGAWAVNICGYKEGTVYPDAWLVFGAHFDIAPPAAYTPLAPAFQDMDVTVTDYVNLDMMGINWHGNWALSCYIGPEVDPDVIDQKLVESFYVVAWWATMTFLTLDQEPILNAL